MSTLTTVNAEQAKYLSLQNAILIDVREPAEYNTIKIPEAKLHPLGSIKNEHLKQYNDKTLLIYCQKGLRGEKACLKILSENPNAKVVNLTGGIEAWQKAGYETIQGTSNILALDRQVQITIGACVLSFSLLAYFYHANFIFASAFMGAGLLFAGISGFCGLARVIALAPWNR